MRRLARWTLNALTALSLLLCVASLVLSVRSDRNVNALCRRSTTAADPTGAVDTWCAECVAGRLSLMHYTLSSSTPAASAKAHVHAVAHPWQVVVGPRPASGQLISQAFFPGAFGVWLRPQSPLRLTGVRVPLWLVALSLGVLPAGRLLVALSRRRPAPAGALPCPGCGYDLRATPAKCPECGRVVEADAAGAV